MLLIHEVSPGSDAIEVIANGERAEKVDLFYRFLGREAANGVPGGEQLKVLSEVMIELQTTGIYSNGRDLLHPDRVHARIENPDQRPKPRRLTSAALARQIMRGTENQRPNFDYQLVDYRGLIADEPFNPKTFTIEELYPSRGLVRQISDAFDLPLGNYGYNLARKDSEGRHPFGLVLGAYDRRGGFEPGLGFYDDARVI